MSNQGNIKWKVFKEIIETEINVKLIIKTVVGLTKILFYNSLFTSKLNNVIFDLTKPVTKFIPRIDIGQLSEVRLYVLARLLVVGPPANS